jgi:hypothetical protein
MNISYLFGLIAGITALITYSFYFKQTIKGQSTPNPATWIVWLIVGIINAITYFSVTGNNLWQSLIVFAVTFSVLSGIEIISFILALGIGIFWQITSNDGLSNLLLQGIYVISFIPTIIGIIKGTGKEHYVAWVWAFTAYLFSTISIAFGASVNWIAFVHPIVNGLIGNGTVALLIIIKRFKERKSQ